MLATISSSVVQGVDGHPVSVEVHVSNGLPSYTLVGLPDASCRESRDRVRAAILSAGLTWPAKRVTINLAPSALRKQGAGLDLPIALGLLAASGQIEPERLHGVGAVGELGLDGSVRAVTGLVSLADAVAEREVLVPRIGSTQAAMIRPGAVRAVDSLGQLVAALVERGPIPPIVEPVTPPDDERSSSPDLADVCGQPVARYALEVAAAGGHHLLMVGPPGAGKTMLASRLVGLLPDLDADLARVVTRVHSAAALPIPAAGLIARPPFRAPHHGSSMVSVIGGGTSALRPGEISNAHGGVLFLDELGEFSVPLLDSLRQPLEEGVIRVGRAARSVSLPARFQLVAAMNPCPCGEGAGEGSCRCSDAARARYHRRLSGPLLDRFDLRLRVGPPAASVLVGGRSEEGTVDVAARVAAARRLAATRGVRCNAELSGPALDDAAPFSDEAIDLLRVELEGGRLTGRGLRRTRSVALTVADLGGGSDVIHAETIRVALGLRAPLPGLLGVRP